MCSRSSFAESESGEVGNDQIMSQAVKPHLKLLSDLRDTNQRVRLQFPPPLTCAYSSLHLYFSPSASNSLAGNNLSLLHVDGLTLPWPPECGPEECCVSLVSADLPTASCV